MGKFIGILVLLIIVAVAVVAVVTVRKAKRKPVKVQAAIREQVKKDLEINRGTAHSYSGRTYDYGSSYKSRTSKPRPTAPKKDRDVEESYTYVEPATEFGYVDTPSWRSDETTTYPSYSPDPTPSNSSDSSGSSSSYDSGSSGSSYSSGSSDSSSSSSYDSGSSGGSSYSD